MLSRKTTPLYQCCLHRDIPSKTTSNWNRIIYVSENEKRSNDKTFSDPVEVNHIIICQRSLLLFKVKGQDPNARVERWLQTQQLHRVKEVFVVERNWKTLSSLTALHASLARRGKRFFSVADSLFLCQARHLSKPLTSILGINRHQLDRQSKMRERWRKTNHWLLYSMNPLCVKYGCSKGDTWTNDVKQGKHRLDKFHFGFEMMSWECYEEISCSALPCHDGNSCSFFLHLCIWIQIQSPEMFDSWLLDSVEMFLRFII